MTLNLQRLGQMAVDAVFAAGADAVKAAMFVKPASFSAATGQMNAAEVSVLVTAFVTAYRLRDLGLLGLQPGDERVLLRASELGSLTPAAGDYLIQTADGLRRDVRSARVDGAGLLWTLQTALSLNEDWGDLAVVTATEDRDELTPATVTEDWMTLS
ncbi:MAG: hypothetical protein HZA90_26345 [Verrucomicrobia bacterium]|nr:hypothetical protein [Verrucomicrobiota bacterium]